MWQAFGGKSRTRENAQLRRSAQNEIQRCEKQLGGCEARKVGTIGSCLPAVFGDAGDLTRYFAGLARYAGVGR